jgi:hypothetical protein
VKIFFHFLLFLQNISPKSDNKIADMAVLGCLFVLFYRKKSQTKDNVIRKYQFIIIAIWEEEKKYLIL